MLAHRLNRCTPVLWLAGSLLASHTLAQAANSVGAGAKGSAPPTQVRFIDAPSSETPAAREKRLKRECKGRANAGACLGHTR